MSWALAVTILGGFAVNVGWWTVIGSSVSLLLLMAIARLILYGSEVRDAHGHESSKSRAHRLADSAVAGFSVVIPTRAAQDLALEARQLLDELSADGAGPWQLFAMTMHFFLRAPQQLRARAKSRAMTPNMQPLSETFPLAHVGRLYSPGTYTPRVAFEIEARELSRVERACPAAGISIKKTALLAGRYGILLKLPRRHADPDFVSRTLREITPVGARIVTRHILEGPGPLQRAWHRCVPEGLEGEFNKEVEDYLTKDGEELGVFGRSRFLYLARGWAIPLIALGRWATRRTTRS